MGKKCTGLLGSLYEGYKVMTIGVDLTVLQTPHRMRGIGATTINFINNLPEKVRSDNKFVFFCYKDGDDPFELLDLTGVTYEVRHINKPSKVEFRLPWKFKILNGAINQTRKSMESFFGDSRIKHTRGIDYFMQFDQSQPLPMRYKVRSCLILYDIIPYVLEADYLWSYKTARAKGKTVLGALRTHYHRRKYVSRLRKSTRRAKVLVAISEHTKRDFVEHIGTKESKITTCLLGITELPAVGEKNPALQKFADTSWGYLPRSVSMKDKEFILYVGGADARRKLHELVAAFNNLRARGRDIYLVFAGDTMLGGTKVPNEDFQNYFKHTAYKDQIYFMGFVTDEQRDWLYTHATAFVYPSVYEGFGLPILEAMQYGTPVITYSNSSINEVAKDAAIYTSDFLEITDAIESLLNSKKLQAEYSERGKKNAAGYSWEKTAGAIVATLR